MRQAVYLCTVGRIIDFTTALEQEHYIELSDLQNLIKSKIGYLDLWVKAEIDSHSVVRGHHYLGLLQKNQDGKETARAKGIIWYSRESIIRQFMASTGVELKAGISIVFRATIEYHPVFGLSLVILDLDSSFTIGQRELERKAAIERLTQMGAMEKQQSLSLPYLPTKIAVLSSKDAAGYGDFMKHLSGNTEGFAFDVTLFQSLMQGTSCPSSIQEGMARIVASGQFDLILILRGGGAESDLYCYDDFGLSLCIANCPVPVLTAIGHERDYHISDMVAKRHFKTPTALADFLIEWVDEVDSGMLNLATSIKLALQERLNTEDSRISSIFNQVKYTLASRVNEMSVTIMQTLHKLEASLVDWYRNAESETSRLILNIRFALNANINRLDSELALLDTGIKAADPRNILKQGYVLAADKNGNILKNAASGNAGDSFSLRFEDGHWDCTIDKTKIH